MELRQDQGRAPQELVRTGSYGKAGQPAFLFSTLRGEHMTELETLQALLGVAQHIESMLGLLLWLGGFISGIAFMRIITLRSMI